jgi:hypothetical protein
MTTLGDVTQIKISYTCVLSHKIAFIFEATVAVEGIFAKNADVDEPLVSCILCTLIFLFAILVNTTQIKVSSFGVILSKLAKALKCHFYCCGHFCE